MAFSRSMPNFSMYDANCSAFQFYWDKDMALDFTTDQYITTEDSKGNSTSYGQ